MIGQEDVDGSLEAVRRIEEAKQSNSYSLDLSKLKLVAIPDSLFQFATLKALDLRDNELTSIPDDLVRLSELEVLKLGGNRMTAVPDWLARLVKLRSLDLGGNRITGIPDSLAQLVNLRILDLGDNLITAVPELLAELADLVLLEMSGNQITTVPEFLGRLSNLTYLFFSRNRITAIPDSATQLSSLENIYFTQNQITAIPDSIARLTSLLGLHLGFNQIAIIPESVSRLASLRDLDLFYNQLAAIPDFLVHLTNLRVLDLDHNQITTIPESLAQLVDLEELSLDDNRITAIPESFAQLRKLKKLSLKNNELPAEILAALKSGIPALFRYLTSTARRKVYPRTVKLVLLGEPKSGKTTLLEALKGNPEPCDESREETIGVDVVSIEKLSPRDHKPMYLSVWDFAGQHMEHATHQFFLTENAIYLILWNARQGTESGRRDLWYWLELLKMRVRNPKFLLVATHTEHTPPDLNLSEIERSYSGCEGNFPVELEGLKGFESVQSKILELAADSPSLRAEWPPEWLPVRDEVRRIRKKQPHVTPATFRTLMRKNHVAKQVAQTDLASQLHHLGEILYFQEPDELSGLVILDPEWVTELIALVVRSKEVRENRGILRKVHLAKLWRHAKLQPKVRDHLIHLMDWFDLTYSTGHQTDLGIVVEALPYSTPQELQEIRLEPGQPQMEMIFSFPSLKRRLPPGIPTWAIARAHRYRKGRAWRDAAAFEDKGTKSQALILASETAREIRLRVAADFPPFFFGALEAILRDTFDRYPGADAERRLPCPCQKRSEEAQACPSSYLFETVLKRKRDGKSHVTCDRSGEDVAIDSLLTGFRPATDEGLHALHSEMRRRFTEERRARNEQMEKTCPSVFTLIPSTGFTQLDTWLESVTQGDELDLTLYCEHDSGWHTTSHSVYRFTPDLKWFDWLKQRWNQLARITKHVGPLAKAFGKVTATPWIEATGLGIEKLPEPSRSVTGALSRELGEKARPEFVDIETRSLLEQLIEHLDSLQRSATEPKKGGLKPHIVEDGRLLWLCPRHMSEYKKR